MCLLLIADNNDKTITTQTRQIIILCEFIFFTFMFFLKMKQNTKYRKFYTCAMCNWPSSLSLRKKKKRVKDHIDANVIESLALFGQSPWERNIFFLEVFLFLISLLSLHLDSLLQRILIHNLSHSSFNYKCFYLEYL